MSNLKILLNMQFRTEIEIAKSDCDITYNDKVFFIGSCFSNNIGSKMLENKFQTYVNPFGTLFNPASIANSLEAIVTKKVYTSDDITETNGLWFSYDFHSSFSSPHQDDVLLSINNKITEAHDFLKKSSYLVITLGTAWVYALADTKALVANCHKQPAALFQRYRLSTQLVSATLSNCIQLLRRFNPELQIIFTVSPIRHWKDGAHENTLSKATLLLGIDDLISMFKGITHYFPAYELVMDDLRDYRFFEKDMLHPNNQAIEYIWEKFSASYFNAKTVSLKEQIGKIVSAKQHRPFNPDTEQHKSFLKSFFGKTKALAEQYPLLDFDEELHYFSLNK